MTARRLRSLVAVLVATVAGVLLLAGVAAAQSTAIPEPGTAPTSASAVSRDDAIRQLDEVRATVQHTLDLLDAGRRDEAFDQAATGYLEHFELVEIPLRIADPELTITAEGVFAETRSLIRDGASSAEVRAKLIELRGLLDDSERRLTDVGVGAPAVVFGQSFLIIFREGLEVVLLLAVLIGYLESANAKQYGKPMMIGVGLAVAATAVTVVLLQTVFARLPVGRELLEAIISLFAVGVLFWVSFWLISRLDHKRWMEFLKARVWKAVSVGSTASLVALGFTAVYREGFETALFYQALLSFGEGLLPYVLAGLAVGAVALTIVAFGIFRLGRKLPVGQFLKVAVIAVMVTSVAFFGNAVRGLQEAFVIPATPLGVPRLPIFLAQATGWWPTTQTVVAQAALTLVYAAGATYMFVIKPRRDGVSLSGDRRDERRRGPDPVGAATRPAEPVASA